MERYFSERKEGGSYVAKQQELLMRNKSKDFEALRNLKQTESQLDLMKRRLSALMIKDEKNSRKAQAAYKKIQYHQYIQDLEQQQREKNLRHRQQMIGQVKSQRQINQAEKKQRRSRVREARQSFQMSKSGIYQQQKKVAKQIQSRIRQLNEREVNSRRKMRESVRYLQEKSKNNYKLFQMMKSHAIRSHREQQQSRMIDLQEKRQVEMRQLLRLQIQMLHFESKSREVAEETRKQLNSWVSPPKTTKSRVSSTGLSSVGNPQQKEMI